MAIPTTNSAAPTIRSSDGNPTRPPVRTDTEPTAVRGIRVRDATRAIVDNVALAISSFYQPSLRSS
jgi:hypothetical protein